LPVTPNSPSNTGNSVDAILNPTPPTMPAPTTPQSTLTPFNFKLDGSPGVNDLKQIYQRSGGNPALVPDNQWTAIQQKYQDALSGKIPTTDQARNSLAGISQSANEFARGAVSTLPGITIDPASNTTKLDASDFITGATGGIGPNLSFNDAANGFHTLVNKLTGNNQTPAVSKEVDNANDFFNKNIQTQVIEKGANIDPSTGIYTPPLAWNAGKVTGVIDQAIPAVGGVVKAGLSLLDQPWTAAAKNATQAVEDAKAALQKSIDNSVPGNLSGNIQLYTQKINQALQSASDYAKQIPGAQNTIDFGNNAINMAKGVINDTQTQIDQLLSRRGWWAQNQEVDGAVAKLRVQQQNAQSLIDLHAPLVADAQKTLGQIGNMPQINQQYAKEYQAYVDKLNAEANTYKAKTWDTGQPNVIAAQKAQQDAIAGQKSQILSGAAKAAGFGAIAAAGGAIGGGATGSAYEILKNLIGH